MRTAESVWPGRGERPIAWLPVAAADPWEGGRGRSALDGFGRKWRGETPAPGAVTWRAGRCRARRRSSGSGHRHADHRRSGTRRGWSAAAGHAHCRTGGAPDTDWYARILIALDASRLLAAGALRVFAYLRLEQDRFEVADIYRIHVVPWRRLHVVRLDGSVLRLAWQPDICLDVGPFGDDGPSETGWARRCCCNASGRCSPDCRTGR